MSKAKELWLHQEVMLLAIRDDKGTFAGSLFLHAVAGAMLSELLLQQKIESGTDKHQFIRVLDADPLGNEVLDDLLSMIHESKKPRKMRDWVGKAAAMPKLKHRVAQQLSELGILRHDEQQVLWVFTQNVYPELDGSYENAIRERMGKVMFHPDVKPDYRTAVLIALANHGGLLNANFPKDELRQHKQRIKQLANGDILATGATKAAIEAVQAAILAATMIPVITAATTH